MVRVGGGWDTLQHYLDKHDPCRCKAGKILLKTINRLQNRHVQSEARGPHAALQPIFAALGPFSGIRKSNLDLLLPEIWPSIKKVWPPLLYKNKTLVLSSLL